MKKYKLLIIMFLVLVSSLIFFTNANAIASNQKYVVSNIDEFNNILSSAHEDTTIEIDGTVTITDSPSWPKSNVTITITGDVLDISKRNATVMGCNLIFDDVTIIFQENGFIYANGFNFTINENVTVQNRVTLFGGGYQNTVQNTNLNIYSGSYKFIYGGSNRGTINGDTNVYIGGNVNSGIDCFDENDKHNFYGGGSSDTILGSTNLSIGGNAKANYVFGGSTSGSKVGKGTNISFYDNSQVMAVYGSGDYVNLNCDVTVNLFGGTVDQIFGGSLGSSLTGDVRIKLLDGKITRRVYGGCYNDYGLSGWKSSYYVEGKITITISEKVDLSFTSHEGDLGIVARTRHATINEKEKSNIIFVGLNAQNAHSSKLGSSYFKKISATDVIHVMDYEINEGEGIITESCTSCNDSHSSNISLILDEKIYYTGDYLEPANIIYSDDWISGPIDSISYSNNINIGTGQVLISINGYQLIKGFIITENKEIENFNNLKEIFSEYYGNGNYIKDTKIFINETNTGNELTEYFHAGIPSLERTTYYSGDKLLMTNEKGFSGYGTTNDNKLTQYKIVNGVKVNESTINSLPGMETYYCTLNDFIEGTHSSSHVFNDLKTIDLSEGWTYSNGVYTSTSTLR